MAGDASALTDVAKLGAAKLDVAGRLEAQDGGALVALVGLDRLVAVDKGAGRLDLKATGTADGPMAVEARSPRRGSMCPPPDRCGCRSATPLPPASPSSSPKRT
jgi:hypothetical protein